MTGLALFCAGLRQLGHEPEFYGDSPTHLTFNFKIPAGEFRGREIQVGLNVPEDFPMTPPSGPHFAPALIKDDGTGQAPRGGLHTNHDAVFKALTGDDWQYWSRPYLNWKAGPEPVRAYLAHVKNLWSQIK